jgi:parallel beta-helix repeat protein
VDRLVVAPDGSGDVRNLEDAVRVAAPGATLLLRAGTHRLSRPLRIDQPLSLVGDGRESTHVVCASPGCVVQVAGNGRFAASDVTFTHEGAQAANVVEVAYGEIDLRRCGFSGGIRDEAAESGGTGLVLRGQVRGTVAGCKASSNEYDGISVGEQAQPVLVGNTCERNTYCGIFYFGTAAGSARNNMCRGNEERGIDVREQAQPVLVGNTWEGNTYDGIFYFATAAGSARNNRCSSTAEAVNRKTGSGRQGEPGSPREGQKTKRNMTDLIVEVARRMGADQHPVSLADLHNTYLQAYPGIGKGDTRAGFGATVSFYTIDMRARFPDPKDHQKPASWLTQPSFKRVAHGRYMLISDEEIARFRRCVAQNDSTVYEDEYDVDKLIPRAFPTSVTRPPST